MQLHELGEGGNNLGDGTRRTVLLLDLLTAPTAVFADQVAPATTALRAWLAGVPSGSQTTSSRAW
jgi:hypothetical protein